MGFKAFLEGGIASIIAGVVTHPLDLIKVRMQLQGEFSLNTNLTGVKPHRPVFAVGTISLSPSSAADSHSRVTPLSLAAHILRSEGPSALFSGVSATILRQFLYSATRIGVYDALKQRLSDPTTGNFPLVSKIAAGLIAGAVGAAVGNPADVAMVRMQADGRLPLNRRRNYKSVVDAIGQIVNREGFGGLWRGSWLAVNRAMIVTASQLAAYDQVKETMIARGTPDGIGTHAAASLVAGLVAAVTSNPIDVVKTRMMNMSVANGTAAALYGGPLDCAVKTVTAEGDRKSVV